MLELIGLSVLYRVNLIVDPICLDTAFVMLRLDQVLEKYELQFKY